MFTLQTAPASEEPFDNLAGQVTGFSLHAGVAEKRLSLTPDGNVRYQLKTPYRDGMTHVIFEPLDFIARLAALMPRLRVNLAGFYGVFAPNKPAP